MPGFDGTGPQGQGKMTGRKFGPCNPANVVERTAAAGDETGTVNTPDMPPGGVVYGLGRGGVPRGGGGRGFGNGNPRRRRFF